MPEAWPFAWLLGAISADGWPYQLSLNRHKSRPTGPGTYFGELDGRLLFRISEKAVTEVPQSSRLSVLTTVDHLARVLNLLTLL
jgi:hypothetical protein